MTAVADLSEAMSDGFDKMDARFDKMERTMADGFAALTSAILTLTPR